MSLLNELKIRNQVIDDEVWVSLKDVSNHTLNAVMDFVNESSAMSLIHPVTPVEAMYVRGLAEGMLSIATFLSQGGVEAEFHEKVNTVEDLLKVMDKNNGA